MKQCFLRRVVWAFAAAGLLGMAWAADGPKKADSAPKAPGEIVVSIRYLQAEGVSLPHLYLYREDGKLLRQLTRDDQGGALSPVFAPDGATIVFSRRLTDEPEYWSVEPRSGKLHKLAAAPKWYEAGAESLSFTNQRPKDWPEDKPEPGRPAMEGAPPERYAAPDGSVELVLGEVKGGEENGVNGPGHGGDYLLRNLKSGKETKMSDLPGFEGLWDLLHRSDDPQHFFHFDGPLRLAFFGLHLDSSDGDTCYALDLTGPRLVRLSQNEATPYPLPGDGAFLTLTTARYLPIPGSRKKEICSFVERWDSKFKKVRYVAEHTAPICYGASLFRPGKTPAVVTIRPE